MSDLRFYTLNRIILSKMSEIEEETKMLFQEKYPALEKEIIEALDSKNPGKLHVVIKKLSDLD